MHNSPVSCRQATVRCQTQPNTNQQVPEQQVGRMLDQLTAQRAKQLDNRLPPCLAGEMSTSGLSRLRASQTTLINAASAMSLNASQVRLYAQRMKHRAAS